jgi:hypothetical protein
MREINVLIDQVKANPDKLKKFYRPVTAFLTFENEEGLNRCLSYNEVVHVDDQYRNIRTLLGSELDIEEASEPTDIIWENRHFTNFERLKRTAIVVAIISFLLLCSFFLLYFLSVTSSTLAAQYPTSQCADLKTQFDNPTL